MRCETAVDVPVTDAQLAAFHGGELIQKAMPNLTPGQREMLISGYCDGCWDQIFGTDEDDD